MPPKPASPAIAQATTAFRKTQAQNALRAIAMHSHKSRHYQLHSDTLNRAAGQNVASTRDVSLLNF
jgi:hypothetical protein